MKNLENYNVQVLNTEETKKIDGGIFGIDDLIGAVVVGLVVMGINDAIDYPDAFMDGLMGR